jgi:molybdopterin converting factor small subunit
MPAVELRLFGHLREYLPAPGEGPGVEWDVPAGSSVGDLVSRLEIPPQDPKIVLVNGVHAVRETILQEGDRVSIFPPIAGG